MRLARILGIGLLSVMLMACACSKKKGTGEGMGETVPTAELGPLPDVYFAFDSSKISDAAKETLKGNAKWLAENAGTKATVEGHCDERGTAEYNMALGERRAKAVYDYLKGLGVATDRLSTISYGKEMPVDPGHNEAAWSKNRRAHLRLSK